MCVNISIYLYLPVYLCPVSVYKVAQLGQAAHSLRITAPLRILFILFKVKLFYNLKQFLNYFRFIIKERVYENIFMDLS